MVSPNVKTASHTGSLAYNGNRNPRHIDPLAPRSTVWTIFEFDLICEWSERAKPQATARTLYANNESRCRRNFEVSIDKVTWDRLDEARHCDFIESPEFLKLDAMG